MTAMNCSWVICVSDTRKGFVITAVFPGLSKKLPAGTRRMGMFTLETRSLLKPLGLAQAAKPKARIKITAIVPKNRGDSPEIVFVFIFTSA
ncbi:MAG: hypothetical protein LBD09_03545 [Treponema sp.]|nr:hypothetical protein [Treponema sp.]